MSWLDLLLYPLDLYFDWTQALAEEWTPQVDQFIWFPLVFVIALVLLCQLVISGVPWSMEKWVPPFSRWLSGAVSFVFLMPELITAYSWKRIPNAKLPQALYNYGDSIIWVEVKFNAFVAWSATWVEQRWRTKRAKTLVFVLVCALLLYWNSRQCGGSAADTCATPGEVWWSGNLWPLLVETAHSMPQ